MNELNLRNVSECVAPLMLSYGFAFSSCTIWITTNLLHPLMLPMEFSFQLNKTAVSIATRIVVSIWDRSDAFGHSTESLCELVTSELHCQLNWLELIW